MQPAVSIIIVNWNTRQMLAGCLDSVQKTIGCLDHEVLVVDNGSTDGSQAMLRAKFPEVQLIANKENAGFARANNQAMSSCKGRYFLLLNSDAMLNSGALQDLVEAAEVQPRAGILGCQLLNPDGSFQASHTRFPGLWQEFLILSGLGRLFFGKWFPSLGPGEEKGLRKVDYVEGACMLVRREAYQEAGGMDESFFMYAEEVDWCYTMREKGWEVWYQPSAWVTHLGGGSSQNRKPQREVDLYRSRVHFFRKHYGNAKAEVLKLLIVGITSGKVVLHRIIRLVSRNRKGRPVVKLSDLMAALRQV